MTYAVIRTGGKQYRVAPGDVLRIERLAGEAGTAVEFTEVLLTAGDGTVRVGTPLVEIDQLMEGLPPDLQRLMT